MAKVTLEIGGQTAEQLEEALERAGFKIGYFALDMMRSTELKMERQKEQINLVHLKVKDLFKDELPHTTDEIYKKAEELGLELCPAEVGPYFRLNYKDQPFRERLTIAMKQIAADTQSVFSVGHDVDGLWLRSSWAKPMARWDPDDAFVFRLRGRIPEK